MATHSPTGKLLGHYRIQGQLGAGGMGVVYSAYDTVLERKVAIKVVGDRVLVEKTARDLLLHEARAASSLNHPNICTIHEVGDSDGEAYIVMEQVEGQPLSSLLGTNGLSPDSVIRYGMQIADALAHAHEHGVIHRDLKSTNAMVTPQGRVKVLDFGLAVRLKDAELKEATASRVPLTESRAIVGTLPYLASELLRGEPAEARTDTWALGVLLYEMASGTHPFRGRTGFELSSAILRDAPTPLPASVPSGLCAVILHCLEKSPADRYQRASEVHSALEALKRDPDSRHGSVVPAEEEVGEKFASPTSEFLDSIAVLPFENVGGEPEIEYLSDGITETIINNLSQLRELRVVPWTTAFRYKGKLTDPTRTGLELRARIVLTGHVVERGDRLIVGVELIDAAHESQLWGRTYDRKREDILSIPEEIATDASKYLRLLLTDAEKGRLAKLPTKSREAYHFYLKAIYFANKWTPEGLQKGFQYCRQAIEADPAYAKAWSTLAYLYMLVGFFGGAPPIETFPKAKAAAVKAMEVDDGEVDAHAVLAFARLVYDWDWHGALHELRRAIELGPNLAVGHYVYSHWYLTKQLYEEATAAVKLALDIDPLSVNVSYHLGAIHYFAGQNDQAIEQLQKTHELDPLFAPAHEILALAYARKGMRPDAMEEVGKFLELATNHLRGKAILGFVSALTGEPAGARKVLDRLRQELGPPNFSFAYHCAAFHALLGEKDDAYECLDKALQGREVRLVYLAVAPEFESLHDDPRFRDVLRRIGIPASGT